MTTVKVRRDQLVTKLQENLNAHVADYREAIAGWRVDLEEWLREQLDLVVNAPPTQTAFPTLFPKRRPNSHEDDYRRVLAMLDMSIDDEIEVQAYEFNQLVMDEWDWSNEFKSLNSSYIPNAKLAH